MCSYLASDKDLSVVRRLNDLGMRVALRMQDRISQLEKDLAQQDRIGRLRNHNNGTFRHEEVGERAKKLDVVSIKLQEYRMHRAYICPRPY